VNPHPAPAAEDAVPSRQRLAQTIPRRPKVGVLMSIFLSLLFAALYAPVVLVDRWVDAPLVEGEPAPITVRVPAFAGYQDPSIKLRGGGVAIARGELVDAERAEAAAQIRAATPHGAAPFYAYVAIALALTLLYTLHLGRTNRGRLLRVQVVHLAVTLAACIATKIALLLSPVSVLVIPVSLAAIVPTLAYDRTVGLATGVWASILVSFLVPFDVGVSTVMVVQAAAAALLIPERHRHPWRLALIAGIVAASASALTYGAFHYLAYGAAPFAELQHPMQSGWAAAAVGGLIAALAAVPLIPLYQVLCGEITQGSLIRHEDLSHPLLKQIAEKAPGSWQHSLAMANMAEIAANAIGANGRFVRVGAYFHDLGKSLQPKYFIENLESGEPSPHDRLPPEVSCDAIFAHVTEGIAVARRHKLPERIIDFMHMHHGNGVLEYFWAKCQDSGNPKHLAQDAFRYPGVPPQSRETAILAICDAVEAASRTLKKPDDRAVASLVQRIVYGKLHLGQLDESGLSMADLRKISDSLRETIKHAHHGRIEYPWQREQAELEAPTAVSDTVAMRPPIAARSVTATQRVMDEPRLDSLDAPRPLWRPRPKTEASFDPASATPSATPATSDPAIQTPSTSVMSTPIATADTAPLRPVAPSPHLIVSDAHKPAALIVPDPEPPPAMVEAPMELGPSGPVIEIVPEAPPPPRPSSSGRAETAPDPRWVQGLAARVDAWLTDDGEGDVEMTVEPAAEPAPRAQTIEEEEPTAVSDRSSRRTSKPPPPPRGPNSAEIAALSDAFAASASATGTGPTDAPIEERVTAPMERVERPRSEHEVDGDDIEATIELRPGAVVGPPPATRPNRTGTQPVMSPDTAPARPASSMLPPRVRGRVRRPDE
jgi:putative nucleotidyltransferase with HDIG domain